MVGEGPFMLLSLDTFFSFFLLSYLLFGYFLPGAPGESEAGEDVLLVL